ncbi:hypothetical protein C2845_PM03G27160 [Panicum miliaceum]|uniref:Nucleolar protein 58/56 N-terminal domain-containing protein n=1 Tax=Panicum miliaceum TaxID=4540 RepID=A0A3L6TBW1_PANMI|nr:hypothetical protein C2845_PM03G27160 [Panicum miliaceum]
MARGEERAGEGAKDTVERKGGSEEEEEDYEDWELEEWEEDDVEEYENWNYFPGLGVKLGNYGIILVLFETPSGFALFTYDGVKLLRPGVIEIFWLRAFQAFEEKSSAINRDTGVNYQLAKMIADHIKTDQKLAVGSPEHKEIIEKSLGISCLHDDTVMEVMWGLKNCMHHFLPDELIKDDHPLICEGLRRVLDKYNCDYKPEIINGRIIEMACVVYNYDYCVDKHSESLREAGKHLKNISGIDSEGWDLLKLATALKMIFSEDELKNLQKDAPKYKDKLKRKSVQIVYEDIVWALGIRNKWLGKLLRYLKDAEEACKAKQAMS